MSDAVKPVSMIASTSWSCSYVGSLHLYANASFVKLNHSSDHTVPRRSRPPNRCTEREPIFTIQICALGMRGEIGHMRKFTCVYLIGASFNVDGCELAVVFCRRSFGTDFALVNRIAALGEIPLVVSSFSGNHVECPIVGNLYQCIVSREFASVEFHSG